MKYIKALRIGHTIKAGLTGLGFGGILLFLIYLVASQVWKIVFYTLKLFSSLHPALASPLGYILGLFIIGLFVYIVGAILSIRIHEESIIDKITSLLERITHKLPGGKFFIWILKGIVSIFKDFVTGIKNIKECSFILIKLNTEQSWEETNVIAVGLIVGKQVISIPGIPVIRRPRITISIPPNPATGFLYFPHRSCILLLKTPRNLLVRLILSFGVLGPEVLEVDPDQSLLDSYYI